MDSCIGLGDDQNLAKPDVFSNMSKPRILIIEDEDLQYEIYEEALADYELRRVTTGRAAMALLPSWTPDLILLDHILAKAELGLQVLPQFKEVLPHVPIIVISGALDVDQQLNALQGPRRAHYFLSKPLDVHELTKTIESALKDCGAAEVVRQFEALERSRRVDALTLFSRSTDRLSRQTEIRKRIAESQVRPNVSALARDFKVARRTIIRDLEELIRRGELRAEVFPKWEGVEEESKD